MCGIIGVVSRLPISDGSWLVVGRDAMAHRGPDDFGEWWSKDRRVGFGHRRLAIIDISPAGHQPMWDITGELCIVFNGEIYNFRTLRRELKMLGQSFRTESDTEVILAAYRQWGEECLSHLEGMFAFAIYDSKSKKLMLARDRAGEKPLFYSNDGVQVRFASEIKGLLADPAFDRRLSLEGLDCYLAMGFVPSPYCILAGVRKLPPAHYLSVSMDDGKVRVQEYWRAPAKNRESSQKVANEGELLEHLEQLLTRSVRQQFEADVPIGILLSGGLIPA